jgi:lipopolysaccharide export system permease protein
MGSIGWYMFCTTMGAFLITVVSLTVVMWFTQAIREFDLITSQRQTLFVFIGITGLLIPLLVMMIAPIALVLAVSHVLNKLSSDSEIIVMNAAGVSPWRLVHPFIAVALPSIFRRAACASCATGGRKFAPTSSPISFNPVASPR